MDVNIEDVSAASAPPLGADGRRLFTTEFRRAAAMRVIGGEAVLAVAADLNVNDSNLRRWVRAYRHPAPKKDFTPEIRAEAVRRLNAGESATKIITEMNLGPHTAIVYKWRNAARRVAQGLPPLRQEKGVGIARGRT